MADESNKDEASLAVVEGGKIADFEEASARAQQIEALLQMDVGKLTAEQANQYLWHFAKRQGLDPTTKPFDIIKTKDGRKVLYANKGAAEQIRRIDGLKLEILYSGPLPLGDKVDENIFCVKVRCTDREGRSDEDLGTVFLPPGGTDRADAIMKCTTKAKRRVTYSMRGLGMPDETEVWHMAAPEASYGPPREGPRTIDPGPGPAPIVDAVPVNNQTADTRPRRKLPPAAPPVSFNKN